ncbi:ABC transporter permease [Sphingobium herbicidovorans NBRC 16415]|uniref:ABC transporter permease n=1 Tax=Sphingobium herbicidovorans (strain ATCC 700291 / DSM 11019 / CCUG 56400 / KCTC 2939 / LMG 18315 / NBRC 16415 / MH) TaxID=1219045 RepID=A0A086P4Y8_SPHHM|nr:ABC transporter permease [Sphingobium herbicidovorans]KFG88456.1 ABC transporter permease [Sphingobium herbicidovorans NBRC 16415]
MSEVLRAALVIARRDFSAVIFSKTFILFLLGPLFPVVIGMAFGGLGEKITRESLRPTVGMSMTAPDAARMERAHRILAARIGAENLPNLQRAPTGDPRALLARRDARFMAIVSGSVERPILTGKASDLAMLERDISLLASAAVAGDQLPHVQVEKQLVSASAGAEAQSRLLTGRAAQVLVFLLTMLLAGMVLSNLVEEKTNKVIEILAAAVPIDSVFLGKLLAMLGMSFVGIGFWGSAIVAGVKLLAGPDIAPPTPAVGWPIFLLLGAVYFTMAYALLGSLFLGIGAQAATVREVQTLNMPVTMAQMGVFFFATYAVDHMGSAPEVAAIIFPFSSPFAMIARAAQDAAIWPHLLAIGWQAIWVAVIIRLGVWLFRRHVLKSGRSSRRRLFRRRSAMVK